MKTTGIVVAASLVAVALLVAVLAGSCHRRRGPAGAQAGPSPAGQPAAAAEAAKAVVRVVRAASMPVADKLELTGSIEAFRVVDVVPEAGGKTVEVHGDVGDYVTRGKLLVKIDTQIQEAQAAQAAAAVDTARAQLGKAVDAVALQDDTTSITVEQARKQVDTARQQLAKAGTAARAVETKVNNGIAQARLGVQSAQTQLQQVRRGARDQERAQAQAALEAAQAQYDFTKSQYDIKKRLYTEGAASGTEFGEALAQYQGARAQLEQARAAASLVQEGPTTEQVRLGELQVEQAREQLGLAEAQTDQIELAQEDVEMAGNAVRLAEDQLKMAIASTGQVRVSSHDIHAAQAGVHQAAAARELALVNISKAKVFAPLSGVISARLTEPGEMAGPTNAVFQIMDIGRVYLNAIVSELDVPKIRTGQNAIVRVDAIRKTGTIEPKEFPGRVEDIYPSSIPNQRNFIARLVVSNRGRELKPGMFARAELTVGAPVTGIVVPRDCIVEEYVEGQQQRRVYAVNERHQIEIRGVEVGAETANMVQIVAGVEEGELLVLMGQRQLEEGQKVETTQEPAKPGGSVT